MWLKLINNGIKWKCLAVIINMYNGIKSLLEKDGNLSDTFPCNIGVRQGENLSPLLFVIYLNDLETSLFNLESKAILCQNPGNADASSRLLTLLYADDTVILASSARDLQTSLNNLSTYSKLWKLKVNVEKTKIMVFSRNGRYSKNMRFVYEEETLEIVKEFKYLGVIFKNNGRFTCAVKHIKAQGNKAMRYVLWKTKSTDMPIDIKFKLYDTLVRPILLYGAEIWGFENSAILEKVE